MYCRVTFILSSLLLSLILALTGCSMQSGNLPSTPNDLQTSLKGMKGSIFGGQQPVAGSHVYVLQAGTSGYGGASTSLLTNISGQTTPDASNNYYVTTDSNGGFVLTGKYTCTQGRQVYLYAVGGNAGAGENSAVGLMGVLGECPSSGTFATALPWIIVNEVTTVAAAYALSGWAVDAKHVAGPGGTLGPRGVANAFLNAAKLADIVSGMATNVIAGGKGTSQPIKVNLLANILAACVNSNGPASTPCSTLFSNARSTGSTGTTATDTATAAIYMAHNPTANVTTLANLATPQAPFQPYLSPGLADLTLAVTYVDSSIQSPYAVAIDANGNAFVVNPGSGLLTKITPSGIVSSFTGPGLTLAWRVGIDLNGNVWTINTNGHSVSKFSNAGESTGYFSNNGFGYPYGFALDSNNNLWVMADLAGSESDINEFANDGTSLIAAKHNDGLVADFDLAITGKNGTIWAASTYNDRLVPLDFSGNVKTLSGYGVGGGLYHPRFIAIDSSGIIWSANSDDTISAIDGATGVPYTTAGYHGNNLSIPWSIAMDGDSHLWLASRGGNSLVEMDRSGNTLSSNTGYGYGSLNEPFSVAVDGSGDVWITSNSTNQPDSMSSVVEYIGAATPVTTPIAAASATGRLGRRPNDAPVASVIQGAAID